jgi:catechol 2,3-dioxygenase-like lactoylglutathione lyase family enzyme
MHRISGIQQIGLGVSDVKEACSWYRRNLGFDILVFDDLGTAEHMLPYTGGSPQNRHAILTINLQGGGGFEFWQYTTRTPKAPAFGVQLGDLGINIVTVRSADVASACAALQNSGVKIRAAMVHDPAGRECAYLEDLNGNLLQIAECRDIFTVTSSATGGVYGAVIGVTDIERSAQFYRTILGYDAVVYDRQGRFDDFALLPGGGGAFRRMLLTHGGRRKGPFSHLLGESRIELVQALDRVPSRIYENRFWGDPGFIHICFDVRNMLDLKATCEQHGRPFVADSNPEAHRSTGRSFKMGGSPGHFSYIEDPDGTLIELVETHRIPIVRKIGWYLDLTRRDSDKPLPGWMLRTLRWNRMKD